MISDELRAKIRRLFFAEHWKVGTIAAELGVHHDAVHNAIESRSFLAPALRARALMLDPYREFIHVRNARYGDFSKMNNRWYAAGSETTHARLAQNPEEWAHYHTMYRQLRDSWPVVPFKEEIRWLSEPGREGLVVGDFGCGEALLAKAVSDRHKVHSFDHVAIDDQVVACDIAHVPLEDGALDVAIFCLSLMGSNFTDYIREAHRCLHLDGWLHIWEPKSYFDDVLKFASKLGRLGFDVMTPETEGAFVRIYAVRNAKKVDPALVLPFRGHGQ